MNKKEFIKTLIDIGGCGAEPETWDRGWDDAIGEVIGIAEELDEPEKVVIPKFVAEYIEQSKKDNDSINQVFAFMDDKEDKDLWHWLFPSMYEEKRANQEVFMRAWLDGYEVEKEKLYNVELPHSYELIKLLHTQTYRIKNYSDSGFGDYTNTFTEAEIKKIDKRLMVFAKEVTE